MPQISSCQSVSFIVRASRLSRYSHLLRVATVMLTCLNCFQPNGWSHGDRFIPFQFMPILSRFLGTINSYADRESTNANGVRNESFNWLCSHAPTPKRNHQLQCYYSHVAPIICSKATTMKSNLFCGIQVVLPKSLYECDCLLILAWQWSINVHHGKLLLLYPFGYTRPYRTVCQP